MTQTVKNPPEMWDTWVQFLCWEDPLKKGMVTHSCMSSLENSMDRGAWRTTVHKDAKSQTQLSDSHFAPCHVRIRGLVPLMSTGSEIKQ